MRELLEQIESLERNIAEKEHELQLLREDLEAIRATVEAQMEEKTSEPETARPAEAELKVLPTNPEAGDSDQEEPLMEEEDQVSSGDDNDDDAAEQEEEKAAEEQDHEAIMRTIEAFASKSKPKKGIHDGPIGDRETLSERAASTRLNDIKKAMGINERFLYANELFQGDMSALAKAVEELNHLESLEDAERLMEEELAIRYQWDDESSTVDAFKLLVSRRFAQ